MSKALLEQRLQAATNYVWSLYFFSSKKRRNSDLEYIVHKVRFRNNDSVAGYVSQLIQCVLSYQIEPITGVENYDGFNSKVSCDKLATTSELLGESYKNFVNSMKNCGEAKLKDKYQGYVLDGRPNIEEEGPGLTFIKMANPIVPLSTKKTVMFKRGNDDTLDAIDETFCRLYLVADSVVVDGQLYNFNHAFERLFNVERTIHKIKSASIQKIIDAGFINNPDDFTNYVQSSNARTFVTLNDGRIDMAKQPDTRARISQTYHITLSETGDFYVASQEEAGNMVKYLCFKVFQETETCDVLEASTVTKWSAAE